MEIDEALRIVHEMATLTMLQDPGTEAAVIRYKRNQVALDKVRDWMEDAPDPEMPYWEVDIQPMTVQAENDEQAITKVLNLIDAMLREGGWPPTKVEEIILGPAIVGQVPPP